MSPCKAAEAAKDARDVLVRWAAVRLAWMAVDALCSHDPDFMALMRAQAAILIAPGPVDVAALDDLGAGEDLENLCERARQWAAAGAPLDNPFAGEPRRREPSPVELAAALARQGELDDEAKVAGRFYLPTADGRAPDEAAAREIERARARIEARRLAASAQLPMSFPWSPTDLAAAAQQKRDHDDAAIVAGEHFLGDVVGRPRSAAVEAAHELARARIAAAETDAALDAALAVVHARASEAPAALDAALDEVQRRADDAADAAADGADGADK